MSNYPQTYQLLSQPRSQWLDDKNRETTKTFTSTIPSEIKLGASSNTSPNTWRVGNYGSSQKTYPLTSQYQPYSSPMSSFNQVNQVTNNYQPPVTNLTTSQYGYKKISVEGQQGQAFNQPYKQASTITIPQLNSPQVTFKATSVSPISQLPNQQTRKFFSSYASQSGPSGPKPIPQTLTSVNAVNTANTINYKPGEINNVQKSYNQQFGYTNGYTNGYANGQQIVKEQPIQTKTSKVDVYDEIERPQYTKLYGQEHYQTRQKAAEIDPPKVKSFCTPLCWVPIAIIGFLLALLAILCGLGVLFAGSNQSGPIIQDQNIKIEPTLTSNLSTPNLTKPNIPNITTPAITSPTITIPTITTPNLTAPSLPTLNLTALPTLNITKPTIYTPNTTLPSITTPNITGPITGPNFERPTLIVPTVNVTDNTQEEFYIEAEPVYTETTTNNVITTPTVTTSFITTNNQSLSGLKAESIEVLPTPQTTQTPTVDTATPVVTSTTGPVLTSTVTPVVTSTSASALSTAASVFLSNSTPTVLTPKTSADNSYLLTNKTTILPQISSQINSTPSTFVQSSIIPSVIDDQSIDLSVQPIIV